MKVMVTGALGYVGSTLCEELTNQNIEQVKIDISLFHKDSISHNIRNYNSITLEDLEGVDTVIHLGAISNDPMGNKYSQLTEKVNFEDSCKLLDTVVAKGSVRKFIFSSSCSNYGSVADGSLVSEESPLAPQTAYAVSKVAFEKYMSQVAKNSDMQLIALRFATACGRSKAMRTDLVLNNFVDSVMRTGRIVLNSSGTANRPLIDVMDMSRFILWSIQAKIDKKFEVYNAGFNVNNFKIIQLAEMVKAELNVSELIYPDKLVDDNRSYSVSFNKISQASGYELPIQPMPESIRSLAEFFNTNKGWLAPTDPELDPIALTRLNALPRVIHRLT